MIPAFTSAGRLPVGVHVASWLEVIERFGFTPRRSTLLVGLGEAVRLLRDAGCRGVLIGGSFVTDKPEPGDFDVAWDMVGVDPDALDPVFFDFDDERAAQKERFGGEFFPAQIVEADTGRPFAVFFRYTRSDEPVGVVAVRLTTLP